MTTTSPQPLARIVSTGPVFAAVLERLNRGAAIDLVARVGEELDARRAAHAPRDPSEDLEVRVHGLLTARVDELLAARAQAWRRALWLLVALALILAAAAAALGYSVGARSQ